MNYRAEIDGLRAVAIIPVVLYHAGMPLFSGGFVGVDVFFVISGYLIATIILTEKREGRFSIVSFYGRRVRRIFPALFLMMAACYPIAWLVMDPPGMREFSNSLFASVTFTANLFFMRISDYFATPNELKPLLHNWSLSVEEQFYLVLPAAILLTWRLGPRRQAGLLAVVALLSLGLAQWQIERGEATRAFFLLHLRLWELLVGVLAAYWLASPDGDIALRRHRFHPLALLGLLLIAVAVFSYDSHTPFPGIAALLPCLGALLVILFATPETVAGRMLGWRPLVAIGLISYSLYLWHYPLLSLTRIATGTDNPWLLGAVCLLAAAVAWLSWRFVEQPVRRMPAMPPLRLAGYAATGMLVLASLGILGERTSGFRVFYLNYRLDAVTRHNYERFQPQTSYSMPPDEGCVFQSAKPGPDDKARFEACARAHGKALVVVGDSHAGNIYRALRTTGRYPFLVAFTAGGCHPFTSNSECPYNDFSDFLEIHGGSIATIVFHISGSFLIRDQLDRPDTDAAFIKGNPTRVALEDIRSTINYLESLPPVSEIIWLGPFAEARVNLRNPANYSPERLRFNLVSLDLFYALDRTLAAKTAGSPAFRYVSLVEALRFNEDSLIIGDCITFRDADHFSPCGEALFGPTIADALAAAK